MMALHVPQAESFHGAFRTLANHDDATTSLKIVPSLSRGLGKTAVGTSSRDSGGLPSHATVSSARRRGWAECCGYLFDSYCDFLGSDYAESQASPALLRVQSHNPVDHSRRSMQ